jgi:hypothetical protein
MDLGEILIRLALIRYYAATAFQPFFGIARFSPAVTLFVSTVFSPVGVQVFNSS